MEELNPPRKGKNLLVLDVDYTLFGEFVSEWSTKQQLLHVSLSVACLTFNTLCVQITNPVQKRARSWWDHICTSFWHQLMRIMILSSGVCHFSIIPQQVLENGVYSEILLFKLTYSSPGVSFRYPLPLADYLDQVCPTSGLIKSNFVLKNTKQTEILYFKIPPMLSLVRLHFFASNSAICIKENALR